MFSGPTHVLVVRGLDENADEEMIRYEFSKHAAIKVFNINKMQISLLYFIMMYLKFLGLSSLIEELILCRIFVLLETNLPMFQEDLHLFISTRYAF